MAKRLTARQRSFLKHYIANGRENAAAAYTAAGFESKNPKVQASQLLKNPLVQAELDRIEQAAAAELKIDAQWVVRKFQDLLNKAETVNDTTNALRAVENIGKVTGAYVEKHEDVTKGAGNDTELLAKLTATVFQALIPFLKSHNIPEDQAKASIMAAFGFAQTNQSGLTLRN